MVGHKTKSVNAVTKPAGAFLEQKVKTVSVFVIKEYWLAAISSKNNVVKSTRQMYAWFACHEGNIYQFYNLSTWKPDPEDSHYVQIGTTPFGTLNSAYAVAKSGDVIRGQNMTFTENLLLNRDFSFTLQGGFDSSFTTRPGSTTVHGKVTISGAGTKVIVDRLIIK